MKELLDQLIALAVEKVPLLGQAPDWVFYLLWMLVAGAALLVYASLIAGITSWVERRIAGRMQARIGPNRVGPRGFLQWIADGMKSLFKEDITPAMADQG